MLCLRCHQGCHPDVGAGSAVSTLNDVNVLGPSSTCHLCASAGGVGGRALVESYLRDDRQQDGWELVTNEKQLFTHRILSQVIYRYLEPPNHERREVEFAVPDPGDKVFLLWSNNHAVGFATLKPKGSPVGVLYALQYALTTVDTVFIRKAERRRGHVIRLLHFLASQYGDVGFSQPISDSMLKVLAKFLTANKHYRRTFWEVVGTGEEGSRKLVWFNLRRANQLKEQPVMEPTACQVSLSAVKCGGQV